MVAGSDARSAKTLAIGKRTHHESTQFVRLNGFLAQRDSRKTFGNSRLVVAADENDGGGLLPEPFDQRIDQQLPEFDVQDGAVNCLGAAHKFEALIERRNRPYHMAPLSANQIGQIASLQIIVLNYKDGITRKREFLRRIFRQSRFSYLLPNPASEDHLIRPTVN